MRHRVSETTVEIPMFGHNENESYDGSIDIMLWGGEQPKWENYERWINLIIRRTKRSNLSQRAMLKIMAESATGEVRRIIETVMQEHGSVTTAISLIEKLSAGIPSPREARRRLQSIIIYDNDFDTYAKDLETMGRFAVRDTPLKWREFERQRLLRKSFKEGIEGEWEKWATVQEYRDKLNGGDEWDFKTLVNRVKIQVLKNAKTGNANRYK